VIWAGGALLGWIAGGLIPEDPALEKYLSMVTKVDLDSTYMWFGSNGHLKWDFDVEPIGILFGLAGAIIVVCAGLYMRRGIPAGQGAPATSH
jgi:hypothetical protein